MVRMVPTLVPLTVTASPPLPSEPASATRRVAWPFDVLARLNLMVQVVARPRPMGAPHILPGCPGLNPAEALVGGILRVGIQPGGGFAVRHLLEEPVLVVIAFTDSEGDVVREQERIAARTSPRASNSPPSPL